MTEEYEQKLKEEGQVFKAKSKLYEDYVKDMEIIDYAGLNSMAEIIEGLMYDFNIDDQYERDELRYCKEVIKQAYAENEKWCEGYQNRPISFDPEVRRKYEKELNKHLVKEKILAAQAHDCLWASFYQIENWAKKQYPRKKNPLNINKKMKNWLSGQGDRLLGVIDIGPLEFVQLTTKGAHGFYHIWKNAKDLEFYNSEEINDDMCVHPFVYVDEDGTIRGHEGRNRAVATFKNGESTFKLAIIGSTGRVRKMPKQLVNQYGTGFKVKI